MLRQLGIQVSEPVANAVPGFWGWFPRASGPSFLSLRRQCGIARRDGAGTAMASAPKGD